MFMRGRRSQFLGGISNVHQNHPLSPLWSPERVRHNAPQREKTTSRWPFPGLDRLREAASWTAKSGERIVRCIVHLVQDATRDKGQEGAVSFHPESTMCASSVAPMSGWSNQSSSAVGFKLTAQADSDNSICFGGRRWGAYLRRKELPLPVIPRIRVWATSRVCRLRK